MENLKSLFSIFLFFVFTTCVAAQDNSFFGNKDLSNESLFRKKSSKKKESIFEDSFSKNQSKYKVIAISAVFNAQKPRLNETKKELNDLFDFCVKYQIAPYQVIAILPPLTIGLDNELSKLMLIGADVSFTFPDYLSKIKNVPSYVAFTNEGYYIFDGIKDVNRLVNTNGQLILGR